MFSVFKVDLWAGIALVLRHAVQPVAIQGFALRAPMTGEGLPLIGKDLSINLPPLLPLPESALMRGITWRSVSAEAPQ